MKRRFFMIGCLLGLAWSGLAASRAAAAQDASDIIRTAVNEVLAVVYDQPAGDQPLSVRVRPVLEKYFDFQYTTQSAIGPGWRKMTPAQLQKAVELFSDLVIRTYADRFDPVERPVITVDKALQPAETRREVPTTITYQGQKYSVSYRLKSGPQGWRVYDVVIENVSMVANYRSQFDELMNKGGPEALLRALEEKRREVAAAAAKP
jgi:phospholipid transport system substrate-binding protein